MTTPTPQGGFAQQLARFRRDHAPRQITLNGTQWSYRVAGNGVRHVLLIPGAVGGGELFFLLVEELSARYRVLATDLPPVSTVRQFLDGLRSILDTERASHVSVLGASYGGLLAQALVRDTPERFDALILSHTGPLLPEQVRANRRAAKIVPYVPLALTRPLLKGLVWLLLRKTPERKFWVAYFREILDQVDSELLATRYKATVDLFSNHAWTAEDLADWHGRAFIIESDKDPAVGKKIRQRLHDLYPRAQVHTFAGTGHGSYVMDPIGYSRVVRDFLDGR